MSWPTILAFLRITTDRRIFERPAGMPEAVSAVSSWLSLANVVLLNPGERHWEILAALLGSGQVSGPLVMDADLAALAIEHGAALCPTDRDFSRFPGLRVLNPLAGEG